MRLTKRSSFIFMFQVSLIHCISRPAMIICSYYDFPVYVVLKIEDWPYYILAFALTLSLRRIIVVKSWDLGFAVCCDSVPLFSLQIFVTVKIGSAKSPTELFELWKFTFASRTSWKYQLHSLLYLEVALCTGGTQLPKSAVTSAPDSPPNLCPSTVNLDELNQTWAHDNTVPPLHRCLHPSSNTTSFRRSSHFAICSPSQAPLASTFPLQPKLAPSPAIQHNIPQQ